MKTLERFQTFLAQAPFMRDLGVEALALSPGRVSTALTLQPRFLQHTGQAHAGVMATLVDHSMGSAAQTLAPDEHWVVTAELKTSVLRPAKGVRLVCEAWVLKPGRMLSFTEGEVFAEDAQGVRTLVMKASATMAVTPATRYTTTPQA